MTTTESPGRRGEDPAAARPRWTCRLLLAALLAVHAVALAGYFVPVVTGADDNGYHLTARLLAADGRLHQRPDDELSFVGRMWVATEDGRYYSKYPPLYPVLVAAVIALAGEGAGLLVSPVLAWSCGLGIYLLCRIRRLPADLALLGALIMATLPLAASFAVSQVSHATSLALVVWGYVAFFAADAARRERPDGGRLRWALWALSGLLLGWAAGVRFTNLLLALPGLVWILRDPEPGRAHWRRLGAWALGWAVPCGLIGLYNWQAFGAPWTTAYSLTDEQGAFALSYLLGNLRIYAATAPVLLAGPVTGLAVAGWFLCWRRHRREAWFHLAWVLPLLVTYLAYYWAPEHHPRSYLRFLLPLAVPLVLLAASALGALGELLGTGRRGRLALVAGVAIVQGAWGVSGSLVEMELLYAHNRWIEARVEHVERRAAPGDVVIADLDLLEPLDADRRYQLYWSSLFDREALAQSLERTLGAGPDSLQADRARSIEAELLEADEASYRERLERRLGEPLAAGRSVWIAGSVATRDKLAAFLGPRYRTRPVEKLDAGPRAHRLFEPGQTVSRARPEPGRWHPAFYIWRIQRRP